jgi:nicotinamidase-related amidase
MSDLRLDPRSTALVLIDLQHGIVAGTLYPRSGEEVVARTATLARRFREVGALVVLVRVDPGPGGRLFPSPAVDQPRPPFSGASDFATLVPAIGPAPDDVVVTKHQPNAFYATDLEVHLVRRGIRTIVLGGISTNVGVEATARAAHERGYEQVFVEDAMAARGEDLHSFPVTRTFPTIGQVRSTADVLSALHDPAGNDPSPGR